MDSKVHTLNKDREEIWIISYATPLYFCNTHNWWDFERYHTENTFLETNIKLINTQIQYYGYDIILSAYVAMDFLNPNM